MITEEQIKNLKEGDPIVIHGKFKEVDNQGDLWMYVDDSLLWFSPSCLSLPSEHGTSVPTPKYDPCRLFRKGDIVRLKEWNGRCPALPEDWKLDNGLFKVHEDEKFNSSVEITRENSKTVYIAPICFLEHVTPVEELEPYYIETETFDYEIRNENDDPDIGTSLAFHIKFQDPDERQILSVKSYYESYVYSREHAEADAEAERDRLNAEYRKERKHV